MQPLVLFTWLLIAMISVQFITAAVVKDKDHETEEKKKKDMEDTWKKDGEKDGHKSCFTDIYDKYEKHCVEKNHVDHRNWNDSDGELSELECLFKYLKMYGFCLLNKWDKLE